MKWIHSCFDVEFLKSESTYLSLCVSVCVCVNESLSEPCEHSGMYFCLLLDEWLTLSDSSIQWRIDMAGTSRGKCFDTQSCMHTHTHIHTYKNPTNYTHKVAWIPAEITEPCPVTGLPLLKKAGREKEEREK